MNVGYLSQRHIKVEDLVPFTKTELGKNLTYADLKLHISFHTCKMNKPGRMEQSGEFHIFSILTNIQTQVRKLEQRSMESFSTRLVTHMNDYHSCKYHEC